MSAKAKVSTVGRRLVASVRELVLVAAYVAISVAVAFPVVVGTGVAIYWVHGRLGLTGYAEVAYFAVSTFALLFVFSKLRTLVLELGSLLLGKTRELAV